MYSIIPSEGYQHALVLDTEGTGNYVQAAYVAHRTPGLLCIKKKSQLINAQDL
jgi:hypothetical protein